MRTGVRQAAAAWVVVRRLVPEVLQAHNFIILSKLIDNKFIILSKHKVLARAVKES